MQSQGFGSRKECIGLIRKGRLVVDGSVVERHDELLVPDGLCFEVDGTPWAYQEQLLIAYHKPIGLECSRTPEHHESIFHDFPFPFLARNLQAAGRLDVETDGLLFLSDNGDFLHHIISPKRAISRTYRVTARHPLSDVDLHRLEEGVELRNEEGLFRAFDLERLGDREIRFSVDRGRYHQVRRMIAALSNRLEALTREAIGEVTLGALEPREWRYLTPEELEQLGWSPER